MHFIDMKQSNQEQKVENVLVAQKEENEYQFPHGLRLCIDEKSLRKLEKRVEDFTIDEEVLVVGKARVIAINKSEGEYAHQSVDLQIEEMQLKGTMKEQDPAEKIYGKDE